MIRSSAFALGFLALAMFATPEASAATGDWTQYGFTAAGRRENTQETILTRKSVPHLVQKWSANIPVGYSAPAVANGLVYIGSTDSHLYAFDAGTGAPVWNAATGGVIQSSPAVANGVVYVGSYDGRVYAFDAETGAVRWATLTGTGQLWSSVTVAGGMVYAGTSNGAAVAINARTGAINWTVAERGVLGTPAISHGVAYFPGGGWLTALDARTGTKIWQQSIAFLGFVGTPAASKGMVFVDTDKMFYAFDAKTGQERWQSSFAPSSGSSIAIANGHVHAGTLDRTLWNFDALTGKLNASKTGAAMDGTPALANGVLYIGSDEQTSTISAYNAANGKLLWRAPTAGWAQSPPTVANGMLYVGSRNQFTAYGLP